MSKRQGYEKEPGELARRIIGGAEYKLFIMKGIIRLDSEERRT